MKYENINLFYNVDSKRVLLEFRRKGQTFYKAVSLLIAIRNRKLTNDSLGQRKLYLFEA